MNNKITSRSDYNDEPPYNIYKPNKNRTRSNRSMPHVPHQHTYDGLHKWYVSMFEKLGWMLLAKNNEWNDKIITYKNSVNRLEEAIIFKHKNTKDEDRKMDLIIMLENVNILKQHIRVDFM